MMTVDVVASYSNSFPDRVDESESMTISYRERPNSNVRTETHEHSTGDKWDD